MKKRIVEYTNNFAECNAEVYEGETLEMKVRRVTENNEPITDGAPIVYTERKDGVIPGYNVRTDKWDIAITAMDAVNRARMAKNQGTPDKSKDDTGKVEQGKVDTAEA